VETRKLVSAKVLALPVTHLDLLVRKLVVDVGFMYFVCDGRRIVRAVRDNVLKGRSPEDLRNADPTPFLQETGCQPNRKKKFANNSFSEMERAEGLTQTSHLAFAHILFVEKCIQMLQA
jgi:hypothetical protein